MLTIPLEINKIHTMNRKQDYLIPEAEAVVLRPEGTLLTVSIQTGAQNQGFTQEGDYDDDDWDIN